MFLNISHLVELIISTFNLKYTREEEKEREREGRRVGKRVKESMKD